MNILSRTPPNFPRSFDRAPPPFKKQNRPRSISARLRSLSEVFEEGSIDQEQKGQLKDMIIMEDPRADEALRRYKEDNDKSLLTEILQNNLVDNLPGFDGLDLVQMNLDSFDHSQNGFANVFSFETPEGDTDNYNYDYEGEPFNEDPIPVSFGESRRESLAGGEETQFNIEVDESDALSRPKPTHKNSLNPEDEDLEGKTSSLNEIFGDEIPVFGSAELFSIPDAGGFEPMVSSPPERNIDDCFVREGRTPGTSQSQHFGQRQENRARSSRISGSQNNRKEKARPKYTRNTESKSMDTSSDAKVEIPAYLIDKGKGDGKVFCYSAFE